ncbi:cyd operon protein [Novosphingobium sp. Rr 2-17]|nr:cytochrome bd-I oxidase subunit CydX [Novosphingobium sp. Rr 2-17]EIZ80747.1 cyd operon protein [Novosphingobium sp. Rr 2-17]
MWYFAWILGLGLAVGFGILNGIWYEFAIPEQESDRVDTNHI